MKMVKITVSLLINTFVICLKFENLYYTNRKLDNVILSIVSNIIDLS